MCAHLYEFMYACVFKEVKNLWCIFIHFQMPIGLNPNVTQFMRYKTNMI